MTMKSLKHSINLNEIKTKIKSNALSQQESERSNLDLSTSQDSDSRLAQKTQKRWSAAEELKLTEALSIAGLITKTYGSEDIGAVVKGWKWILERKASVAEIIAALEKHIECNTDFPTPADINNILFPPEPKITRADVAHARKQLEIENYPMLSPWYDVIKKFKEQQDMPAHDATEIRRKALSMTQAGIKQLQANGLHVDYPMLHEIESGGGM